MLQLSEMFEDHMVLQWGRPVPVWGECDREGAYVTVTAEGREAAARVKGGRFCAYLPALMPGGPFTLRAECGGERVEREDVLAGEVWLAGGQSNMEMPLFAAQGAKEYLEKTAFSRLRLKTISRRSVSLEGREFGFHFIPESSDEMPWQQADAHSAALFSAMGCVAGQKLQEALDIPVGVISCNYGATQVQPWVSPETLKEHPAFRGDEKRYAQRRAALGEKARESWELFQRELREAVEDCGDFVEKSLENPLYYATADAQLHWPPEYALGDQNEPGCLYRCMLSRVIPFAMRGVWWYQGESSADAENCGRYQAQMEAMIDDWRRAFENDSLVFIQTQLAPYDTSRRAVPCDWPRIRQAQLDVCRTRNHVHLINLTGIGENRNIHPRPKIEAGLRMAWATLNEVYHHPAPEAPQARLALREGPWLRILFDHGEGLHMDGAQLETGDGERFAPAEQWRTEGDSLLVRTEDHFVRYGWDCIPGEALKNCFNLGATPFCIQEGR